MSARAPNGASGLPPELRARILAKAAAVRAPSRAERVRRAFALVAVGAAFVAALTFVHGRRADWDTLPPWASWLPFLDASLAAMSMTFLTMVRGRRMLGAPIAWVIGGAVAAPMVAGVAAVLTSRMAYPDTDVTLAHSLATALRCDGMALALGIPLIALMTLGLRDRTLPQPGLVGAAVGVSAGVWAHAMLIYICPFHDSWHIVVGHVMPALALGVIGAVLGALVARMRSRSAASSTPTRP